MGSNTTRVPEIVILDGFGPGPDEVRAILEDAIGMMTPEEAASLGETLHIIDSDMDRVWLSRDPEGKTDDFTIRTWDFHDDGSVDWTLFRTINDADGSSRGEEICSGTTLF